jgi:formate/nitrite transporter FocA (FNT family)
VVAGAASVACSFFAGAFLAGAFFALGLAGAALAGALSGFGALAASVGFGFGPCIASLRARRKNFRLV